MGLHEVRAPAPARELVRVRCLVSAVHACVDCRALPADLVEAILRGSVGTGVSADGPWRPAIPRKIDPRSTPRRPRCATHWRAADKARKAGQRANNKAAKFGLSPELQQALWAFQGGRCPCGAKVADELPPGVHTDHDHDLAREHDHPDDRGCPLCVLGFLCVACNRDVIGRFSGRRGGRAEVSTILRALADFLDDPPMRRLLDERNAA